MQLRTKFSLLALSLASFLALCYISTPESSQPHFIEHLGGSTYIMSESAHTNLWSFPWSN